MGEPFNAMLMFTLFIEAALLCSCRNSSLSCKENERQALLQLKQSFWDPSHALSSWKGKNCCIWKGISCNEQNGHVVKLNLRADQSVASWFPNGTFLQASDVNPCLLDLKYLEYLDLSGNDFQGSSIPQFFGLMKQLRYLNISEALISGSVPRNLGNLTRLRVLDLGQLNKGSPPMVDDVQWLSQLASLEHLGMAGISLAGAPNLFQVLNMLPSLKSLRLSQCGLDNSHLFWLPINSTYHASLEHLDIGHNSFEGPLPIALQNMTSLKVLDLSFNRFNSSIPTWFGNFKNLVHLNLASNDLISSTKNGLVSLLGNMCYLKSLDLSNNLQFQGILGMYGSNLSGCAGHNLEELKLSESMIGGHLPDWLFKVKNLKYLDLSWNSFQGTIPESLGQLSNLQNLDLSHNSLGGDISEAHFATLSKLKTLSIGFNNLIVKINSNWVPPFQLESIQMESCIFGTQFPQWLQTQLKATALVLSNTSIWGTLPRWIGNLINLSELDLSHNQISGQLPKLSPNLMSIDLSNNFLSGNLTEMIGHSSMLPKLHTFILSNNLVSGSIPNSFCDMEELEVLQLYKNKLSGNIPDCWRDYSLYVLDLSHNNLSGPIPGSIGQLNFTLQWLHLGNNNLSGEPPMALKSCTSLVVLDLGENALSGNLPEWMGENFSTFLNILNLGRNKFNGNIPLQLCQIYSLQILDLADNNLKGRIPHCFGNFNGMVKINVDDSDSSDYSVAIYVQWYAEHLTEVMKGRYMEYTKNLLYLINMDLSRNNLEGTIPEELTLLTGLIGLNLSHNNLSGKIPKTIGKLEWLESLDLSVNHLSGMIPDSMSSLTKLSYLNLSYNNLSGKIPNGNQLQTLEDPSSIYAGNPLLCGASIPKKCWDGKPHQGNKFGNRKHKSSEDMWFYIVVMSGFATGFWGVVGFLIFNKSWRRAYFLFVDRTKDRLLVLVALKMASLKKMIKLRKPE